MQSSSFSIVALSKASSGSVSLPSSVQSFSAPELESETVLAEVPWSVNMGEDMCELGLEPVEDEDICISRGAFTRPILVRQMMLSAGRENENCGISEESFRFTTFLVGEFVDVVGVQFVLVVESMLMPHGYVFKRLF